MTTASMKRFSLEDKIALVAAGAGGLGSAVSRGLAEAGAAVVVADARLTAAKEVADQITKSGGRSLAAKADLSMPEDVDLAVDAAIREFGRIDIMINLACDAVLRPIIEMTLEQFDHTVFTCLKSAFLLSQSIGKVMIEQGTGGSVVHVSSIAGSIALGRGTGVYAATKAGVNALVRELAVEWAPHRIRVNAVAPCQFRTPGLEKVLDDPRFGGREALSAKMIANIPIGRFGEPEDLIGPCVFLASDAAAMVTGHLLFVDGGYTAR